MDYRGQSLLKEGGKVIPGLYLGETGKTSEEAGSRGQKGANNQGRKGRGW